jgi:AraC-like DNA-binding protein
MAVEGPPLRLSDVPLSLGSDAESHAPEGASEWRGVVSVLAAVDELAACADTDSMLRKAVELARTRLGLERVGIYLSEKLADGTIAMRGTWGTGRVGETTDEHRFWHECSPTDCEILRRTQVSGGLWLSYPESPYLAQEDGQSLIIGQGWVAVTPLVSGGEVVGMMYNDTAISRSPVDEGKQARAAVFCRLLADLVVRRTVSEQKEERSPLVRQILESLGREPPVSGEQLAKELGISPGHLARSFKSEMGCSLVEYRNRLRVERFFATVDRGGSNIQQAAEEAGFGSYAQFHRVFRKLIGTTPREYLTGRKNPVDGPPSTDSSTEKSVPGSS